MSASQLKAGGGWIDAPERCEMAVVYDDTASRDRAIRICDSLVNRFKGDLDFEFTWWNVRFFEDPAIEHLAEQAAAAADLIFFSIARSTEPSLEVKNWIEGWLACRETQEGALAVWVDKSSEIQDKISPLEIYLREVAQRGHLDFLPLISPAAPIAPEVIRNQGSPGASGPGDDLPLPPPISHWGINE